MRLFRSRCKAQPSAAEKRRILMREYTFRLPHKSRTEKAKEVAPEDEFPPEFKYRHTCRARSYKLNNYFNKLFEEPVQSKVQLVKEPTTVAVIEHSKSVAEVVKRVSGADADMDPGAPESGQSPERVPHSTQELTRRRDDMQSSTLWDIASKDVMIKKGMVNKQKMIELYGTVFGSLSMIKENFNPYKVYNWGEKGSGLHSMGLVQDFRTQRDSCLSLGILFEDPHFPANESSLSYSKLPTPVKAWKRPGELCKNPKLFIEGVSRFDVRQGELGNCWMLAALCSLTMNRKLLFQVVPLDQAFDEKYAGIFHFRLWNDGKWIDVVVDDRLPVNGKNKLCFVKSSTRYEFWPALLEKAYAKLQGSYEHIEAGFAMEALIEFTGGLVEILVLKNEPQSFEKLKNAWDRDALICISSNPSELGVKEKKTPQGIVSSHAYTVTSVVEASYRAKSGPMVTSKLLRLRNPWGNFGWNGAWSVKSPEWKDVPPREKRVFGLQVGPEGEFWMSFTDILETFATAHVCHVSPAAVGNAENWILTMIEGEWVKGVTAGGSRVEQTYHMNPQYLLNIPRHKTEEKTNLIVSLLSKNRRRLRHINHTFLSVNVSVFPVVHEYPKPLPPHFFRIIRSLTSETYYKCHRDVSTNYHLGPGLYVVIPSSWDQAEGEFLLRFYSEHKIKVCPYDAETGIDVRTYKKGYASENAQIVEDFEDLTLPVEIMNVERDNIGNHSRPELLDKFKELAGEAEEIGWTGLQSLLEFALQNVVPPDGFNKDICRSLVALVDKNCSGKLDSFEFFILWNDIVFWVLNFNRHANEKNEMTAFRLRLALRGAGFTSTIHLMNLMMHRYGNKAGVMNMHDYLMAVIKFKHMIEAFKKRENLSTKRSRFFIADFFELVMYS